MYHHRPAAIRTPIEIANAIATFCQIVILAEAEGGVAVNKVDAGRGARGTLIDAASVILDGSGAVIRVDGVRIPGTEV